LELLWLGRQAWSTFQAGCALEWLETNGLGGWAFGTVVGASTRLYHGLLAASLEPPARRVMLLARVEETLVVDGRRCSLAANEWASGHVEAPGLPWLQRFALAPFPTWTYCIGDLILKKRLFMRHGQNCTVIRYQISGGSPGSPRRVTLELRPLLTCRSIHAVLRANDWPFAQRATGPSGVAVEAYPGAPRVYLATDAGQYSERGEWVYALAYPYERLRGEHTEEDLYRPGFFAWTCEGDGELTFAASTEPLDRLDGPAWEEAERERRAWLLGQAALSARPQPAASLVLAADQFAVFRQSTGRRTLLAGYPWFTDWGRDSMIALPGLTLATGRFELAKEILGTFAAFERDGLIPNHFPEEGGEPMYNTADASLWFFEATWRYLKVTGDSSFVLKELYPVMRRILLAHLEGTHFEIRATPDGLLRCGHAGVQVTWMDAKVDDRVVTPRDGKPVEIQALWYNALRILSALAALAGEAEAEVDRWRAQAKAAAESFEHFWNPDAGCLHDLIRDDGTPDPAVRPNQLLALSLSHPLLSGPRARSVVDVAFRELYTPYGLRSLSPREPAYQGRYEGSRPERDAVYHQGTVWAWLMGPFIRAYLHAYGRKRETLEHARRLLEPLLAHLGESCLGSVAEIFDGDAPHLPRGCVAQAWSVAELLWLLRYELVER